MFCTSLCLISLIFLHVLWCCIILSDHGTLFTWGAPSNNHPQTNGQVVRANQEIGCFRLLRQPKGLDIFPPIGRVGPQFIALFPHAPDPIPACSQVLPTSVAMECCTHRFTCVWWLVLSEWTGMWEHSSVFGTSGDHAICWTTKRTGTSVLPQQLSLTVNKNHQGHTEWR